MRDYNKLKFFLLILGVFFSSIASSSTIEPGFDLFATPANVNTQVEIVEGLPIRLRGNTALLNPPGNLFQTDTIVARTQPLDGTGVIPIELVALSLVSVNPVELSQIDDELTGTADMFVTVNSSQFFFNNSGNAVFANNTLEPAFTAINVRGEGKNIFFNLPTGPGRYLTEEEKTDIKMEAINDAGLTEEQITSIEEGAPISDFLTNDQNAALEADLDDLRSKGTMTITEHNGGGGIHFYV